MTTTLFTFPSDKERDAFLRLLADCAATAEQATTPEAIANGDIIRAALNTARVNVPIKEDHERVVALFISGKKIIEGSLSDLRRRFQQEVDSHSATVELRELRGGLWVTIQSRRQQRLQA